MFTQQINSTIFNDDVADELFVNIKEKNYCLYDHSFIATLRALLGNRAKENNIYLNSFEITDNDLTEKTRKYPEDIFAPDSISLLRVLVDNKDEYISDFENNFSGWEKVERVSYFFQKSFSINCYINTETKSVIIVGGSLVNSEIHYLQCSILAFLPWYFNPANGDTINQKERILIESLNNTDSEQYFNALESLSENYDFRQCKIKKNLAGFEIKCDEEYIDSANIEINSLLGRIKSLNNDISSMLKTKEHIEEKICALKYKARQYSEADDEILNFFLSNKCLELINVYEKRIRFGVKSYAEYFDEDIAQKTIENPNGFLYENVSGAARRTSLRKILELIFIQKRVKLRTCAAFTIEIPSSLSTYTMDDKFRSLNDYLLNPHINRFGCMGNYTTIINELLAEGDYVGVVTQCIASTKSLNFLDSTVMRHFGKDLISSTEKVIELETGELMTVTEALKLMEEQENE